MDRFNSDPSYSNPGLLNLIGLEEKKMKVQVSVKDMETVGYWVGNHAELFCLDCADKALAAEAPKTPQFRKSAEDYRLTCYLCGKVLAE